MKTLNEEQILQYHYVRIGYCTYVYDENGKEVSRVYTDLAGENGISGNLENVDNDIIHRHNEWKFENFYNDTHEDFE